MVVVLPTPFTPTKSHTDVRVVPSEAASSEIGSPSGASLPSARVTGRAVGDGAAGGVEAPFLAQGGDYGVGAAQLPASHPVPEVVEQGGRGGHTDVGP